MSHDPATTARYRIVSQMQSAVPYGVEYRRDDDTWIKIGAAIDADREADLVIEEHRKRLAKIARPEDTVIRYVE